MGQIDFPVSTMNPLHQNIDLYTLIKGVVHTNRPDITEQSNVLLSRHEAQDPVFQISHIDMKEAHMIKSTICKVQPSKKASSSSDSILTVLQGKFTISHKISFSIL